MLKLHYHPAPNPLQVARVDALKLKHQFKAPMDDQARGRLVPQNQ